MFYREIALFGLLAMVFAVCACSSEPSVKSKSGDDINSQSDDDTSATDDDDFQPHFGDDSADDDTEIIVAGWEYFLLDGEPAPPNPSTGAETPPEFNVIPIFRFRPQSDIDRGGDARPVRAVLIMQPGYVAGATQMFFIARHIVEMSGGRIEVWVPDRRHTLLEDQLGMDTAEQARDPWIAWDYYMNGVRIGDQAYHVLDAQGPETDMMSEWGLDLQMKDTRRVTAMMPEANRRTNLFLGGDSRGVAFTQAYAACVFDDGMLGSDELAGLVLWDGGVRNRPGLVENLYLLELAAIRRGLIPRTVNVDPSQFVFMEIFGLATAEGMGDPDDPALGPDGVFPSKGPFEDIFPLLTRFHDVTVTNEAFMGMLLDQDTMPLPSYMGHFGRLTGGPIGRDILGEYPSQNGGVYSWLRWNECDPPEYANIQNLAHMLYEGPSNFSDPYYSARLDLDMAAADFFMTAGTWRDNYFHFDSRRVDAPVFAFSSRLYEGSWLMRFYQGILPPVRGQSLPRSEAGFDYSVMHDWGHIDGIFVEPEYNPVLPALIEWMNHWSEGEVVVPTFGSPRAKSNADGSWQEQ